MKQNRFSFLLILVFLNFSFFAKALTDRVKKITIEGNLRIESAAVKKVIKTQVGSFFNKEKIKEDIAQIYELGRFSEINVYKERDEEGELTLFYSLKEKPYIKSVKFFGLDKITEETLKEVVTTKSNTVVDEEKILKDYKAIEKKYKEKGFFLVKISYKVVPINDKESELHFTVAEGDKILIGDITLIGNNNFSDEELLSQFFSGALTKLNSIMSSRSNYSPEIIARDVAVLGYFYKNNGFANISIARPIVLIDKDRKYARVTIKIEEGKQFKVDKISFEGDVGKGEYSEQELLESLQLKPGEIFRHSSMVADIEKVSDLYGDKGYAHAYINPVPTYDKEKGLVSLNYRILKRDKIYIGEINIVGNTTTRDNVIRRELVKISDGGLYSGSGVSESRANIMRLGFFEEVKISKSRSEQADDIFDIKITVKEKSTGQLRASFGVSPSGESGWGGLFGEGSYSQKNQSGKGWSLSGTGKYFNSENFLWSLDFSNPRVADTWWYSGASVSWASQVEQYGVDSSGLKNELKFDVTAGHMLFEKVRGFVTYSFKKKILQEDNDFVPDIIPLESYESGIGVKLSRNSLDNYVDPSSGSQFSLSQRFLGGIFGGSEKYEESLLDLKYYYPIDLVYDYKVVLKLIANAGKLWGDVKTIPLLSRYRLGGAANLRGYDPGSIGPISYYDLPDSDETKKYYKGGNLKFYSQLELLFPLLGDGMVKGVFFGDAGQVFSEGDTVTLRGMKYDFGFGFRWKTPMAPLRFEWAYPVDTENMEVGKAKFIFSVGT